MNDQATRPSAGNSTVTETAIAAHRSAAKPDEARAYIDEQIKKLEESVRSLKSARNRLAPISKFPSELLSHVFKYVNEPQSANIRDLEVIRRSLSWRELNTIACVCRTWRRVALECPSLWSRLIFYGKISMTNSLEEMLSRSKSSPLSIQLMSTAFSLALDALLPPLPVMLFDLEIMRELHVSLSHRAITEFIGGISGTTAGKMQSLLIRNTTFSCPPTCDISLILFSAPMPQLLHLDIHNCNVRWDSLKSCISHALLSLRLSDVTQPSRGNFFDLLSRIPNLEVLHLKNALPPISSTDLTERVVLRSLKSCTIRFSSISQCLDFQRHISYPVIESKLEFYPYRASGESFDDEESVNALLSSCAITVDNPQRRHSRLFLKVHSSPGIILWDDKHQSCSRLLYWSMDIPNPRVVIDLLGLSSGGRTVPPPIDFLSIPGLDILAVSGLGERYTSNEWSNFFSHHRDITQLHLSCSRLSSLMLGLSHSTNNEHAPTGQLGASKGSDAQACSNAQHLNPCLPKLAILTLEHHVGGEMPKERECITKLLTQYHEMGSKIQRLNLLQCFGVDDEIVKGYQEMVDEVSWDGVCLSQFEDRGLSEDGGSEDLFG